MPKKHRARHIFSPANQLYATNSAKSLPGRAGIVMLRRLPGLSVVATFESMNAAVQNIGDYKNIRARWGPRVEAYVVRGGREVQIIAADWRKLGTRPDLDRIAAVNAAIRSKRGVGQVPAGRTAAQPLRPQVPAALRRSDPNPRSKPKRKPLPRAMMTRYIDQDVG